jgi:hypothetical protein
MPVHIFDIRARIAKEIAFEMWKVVARFLLLRPNLMTATAS